MPPEEEAEEPQESFAADAPCEHPEALRSRGLSESGIEWENCKKCNARRLVGCDSPWIVPKLPAPPLMTREQFLGPKELETKIKIQAHNERVAAHRHPSPKLGIREAQLLAAAVWPDKPPSATFQEVLDRATLQREAALSLHSVEAAGATVTAGKVEIGRVKLDLRDEGLYDRLPEHVFIRIQDSIVEACGDKIDEDRASAVAYNLGHYIADRLDDARDSTSLGLMYLAVGAGVVIGLALAWIFHSLLR